ncbi:Casein kinase I-2-like protein [Hordeum vulgare]|nr:Casein kinase I-2-like protein [Hordeum vulgare]
MGNAFACMPHKEHRGAATVSRSKRMGSARPPRGGAAKLTPAEEELLHRQALAMANHQHLDAGGSMSCRIDAGAGSMSRRIGPGSTSSQRHDNLLDSVTNATKAGGAKPRPHSPHRDGSSINVWNDRWIPSTRTMIPTVKPPGATVVNVSELLNMESGTWRVELVRANFAATDAAAILNIPLRRGGGADFLAWAHEKSGNYTVKSAYRALMTHKEQSAQVEWQVSDASVAQTHLWKLLWALKSIKYTREALALLEIPKAQAATLPGYGWQPPEGNQVKINTDAAVDILRQQCVGGGVARSRCSLLGALAKPHAGVTDPLIAETLVLREGVIFASLRGFPNLVMETDCQEVVNL